jgi:hypothetical protein
MLDKPGSRCLELPEEEGIFLIIRHVSAEAIV